MPAGNQRVIGPVAPEARPQRASASSRKANPRDHTGRLKQKLEAQVADDHAEAEQQMAMAATQARQARRNNVIDYSQGGDSAPGVIAENAPVIGEELDETEVQSPFVEIRVSAPIEDMVFGRSEGNPGDPEHGVAPTPGNLQFYSFEEGPTYIVPRALADHLERLDYVYH